MNLYCRCITHHVSLGSHLDQSPCNIAYLPRWNLFVFLLDLYVLSQDTSSCFVKSFCWDECQSVSEWFWTDSDMNKVNTLIQKLIKQRHLRSVLHLTKAAKWSTNTHWHTTLTHNAMNYEMVKCFKWAKWVDSDSWSKQTKDPQCIGFTHIQKKLLNQSQVPATDILTFLLKCFMREQ